MKKNELKRILFTFRPSLKFTLIFIGLYSYMIYFLNINNYPTTHVIFILCIMSVLSIVSQVRGMYKGMMVAIFDKKIRKSLNEELIDNK